MPYLNAISYYLPEKVLSNNYLNQLFPDWSVDKIAEKTGILERRIAADDEYVSSMAVKAAKKLFSEHNIAPENIEYILLCTQSPDYFLPTTACLVQDVLGIPTTAGALDFNQGCSGYIYGLSLAKGLILSEDVKNVLLITSETYSKFLNPEDRSVRTIFGDAAAATLISGESRGAGIGKVVLGTDGSGADHLIMKAGALRHPADQGNAHTEEHNIFKGLRKEQNKLKMDGADVFTFTLKAVPTLIEQVLQKNALQFGDIDLFVFHQANRYMLSHLRKKLNIPEEKFFLFLENCGNTVSSTIPIALSNAQAQGKIRPGMKVLLAGFGVGYSWGATIIQF